MVDFGLLPCEGVLVERQSFPLRALIAALAGVLGRLQQKSDNKMPWIGADKRGELRVHQQHSVSF